MAVTLRSVKLTLVALGIGASLSSCSASGTTIYAEDSKPDAHLASRSIGNGLGILYFTDLYPHGQIARYSYTADQCPWTLYAGVTGFREVAPPQYIVHGDGFGPFKLVYDTSCIPVHPGAWEVSYVLTNSRREFIPGTVCSLDMMYTSGYTLKATVINGTYTTCDVESGTGFSFYYNATYGAKRKQVR